MCEREGLHQLDLLTPAPEKITETEFRANARGQKNLNRSIGKLYRKGSSQLPQHFRLRKIFSGKPSKNVPNLPEILKSSNLFFWRITTYPCFPNGEDTAICTRTVTEGSQKKLWEQTTARNIWKSGFSRTKKNPTRDQRDRIQLYRGRLPQGSCRYHLLPNPATPGCRSTDKCESNAKRCLCPQGQDHQSTADGKYPDLHSGTRIRYQRSVGSYL